LNFPSVGENGKLFSMWENLIINSFSFHSKFLINKTKRKCFQIPRHRHEKFNVLISSLLMSIVMENSQKSWKLFFMFKNKPFIVQHDVRKTSTLFSNIVWILWPSTNKLLKYDILCELWNLIPLWIVLDKENIFRVSNKKGYEIFRS
jgi:hypothetical protein